LHAAHSVKSRKLAGTRVLILSLWLLPQAGYCADSAQQLAQRVDKYYNGLHALRTSFTETFDGMGIHRQESGSLLLRKPGKMRWDYDHPAGKLFVLDGKYAWFYTPGDAQVVRVGASQMDDLRSPLRFLLGHTQLEKELDQLTLTSSPTGLELSGVPKGMRDRVAKIILGVNEDGVIHSMKITETDGAETAFSFQDVQANPPAPDAEFVFKIPQGVPVVDGLPPV
jgi:outer membrane lipoprotein carrier protein